MYSFFFEMPYAIFGVPTLFLLIIILAGFLLGALDLGLDFDADSPNGGLVSGILISTGVSRVPLVLGMLVSLSISFLAVISIYDNILMPLIPLLAKMIIYALHPFIFIGSLYVAGYMFKRSGIENLFTNKESEKATNIIGLKGYAVSDISTGFGRASVAIKGGASSFSARPLDEDDIIPISTDIKVVAEHPDSPSKTSQKIYIVTRL